MQASAISLSGRNFWEAIRAGIFFVLFYLYLWLMVKPEIIYHGCGEFTNFPVFYRGWAFFNETVWRPGGLIEYLSDFLSQLLYYSWLGALVLTVHAFLVCVFTGYFLKRIGITRLHILSFIPAVLLLITYNGYTYHFTSTLALLAALVFACLYVVIAPKEKILSLLLFLFLTAVLYLIAAGAYLYFALLCGVYEVIFNRRWLVGILNLILAVLAGYVLGILVFNISLINVYSELLPFSWRIIGYPDRRKMMEVVYILYWLLPSVVLVFGSWRLLTRGKFFSLHLKSDRKEKSGKARGKDKSVASLKSSRIEKTTPLNRFKWSFYAELLFLFVAFAGAVFGFHNSQRKAALEVDYYLCSRDWIKVLEIGRRYQDNDHISHALNRALYHLGRLPSDMFCYQQRPRCLLLTGGDNIFSLWFKVDTFYDLGAVNRCECSLVESMEVYGERPQILKRMATIRIAKNDINTAMIYLGALSKTLFDSGWAEDYLHKLQIDPNLSTDKEIQRLRSLMPENDKASLNLLIDEVFIELLEKNPKNRMAFEYLMTFYLFKRDLDMFVRNISRFDDFGYQQIPRHYEEAILTYTNLTKKHPDLKGRAISKESQQRFTNFVQIAGLYKNNPQVAFIELAKRYGDTYQFFYVYSLSGLKNE